MTDHQRGGSGGTEAPVLVDLAPQGRASQSSWPAADLRDRAGQDAANTTHIRTGRERAPWWMVDLGDEWPVESIVLHHPRHPVLGLRSGRLGIEVSRDGTDWVELPIPPAWGGRVGLTRTVTYPVASRVIARHVRLSRRRGGALELAQVQILVRKSLIACRRIEAAWGFDLRRRHGGYDPMNFQVHVEVEGATPEDIDGPLVGLSARQFNRFGNNVIQTVNMLHVAAKTGVGFVRLPPIAGQAMAGPVLRNGLMILPPDAPLPPGGAVLASDFYFRNQYGGLFAGFDRAAEYALAREVIRPHLRLPKPDEPPGRDEVVIHFRAGDIFRDQPHPNYIQPPLCFYQAVIDKLAGTGIRRACLVHEDRGNPCIAALEAWLDGKGMPWRTQSGTLEQDLGFLLRGRHLVFGAGTFGFAICLLAGKIGSVHAFDAWGQWGQYRGLPNIRLLRIGAVRKGSYIPPHGWKNTPEQRQLMIDLPRDDLVLHDIPPPRP